MKEHRFVGVPQIEARAHLRADGRPKRKRSEQGAQRLADKLGCSAYRCPRCGAWHVGTLSD